MRTFGLSFLIAAWALFAIACNGDDDAIVDAAIPIDADEPIDAEVPIDAEEPLDAEVPTDAEVDPAVQEVDCDDVTPDAEISIDDGEFIDPEDGDDGETLETTIDVGEIVRWTNEDDVDHTVTSGLPEEEAEGELFDSGTLEPDDEYCLQFDEAGDYPYFSETDPDDMQGTIIVEED